MSETPDFTPPAADPAGPAPEPPAEHGFFTSIRRADMARPQDRWVGGVSGAVARRLGIDPLIVRALFVASVFFAGIGLVLYGVGWALLPEESDGRIHAQELGRGNSDVALLGAAGFVLAGLVAGDGRWTLAGWWNAAGLGWINGVLWLAVVGVVVAIVISGARMSPPRAPAPGAVPPPPPAPAYRSTPRATATAAAPLSPETPMSTPTPPPPAPQYAQGPQHAPGHTPGPPPEPPRPKTPPVPGAGARFFAVCTGITLLALAALLLFERAGLFTGPVLLTTLGITAVVFGLGIIVAGLRGRSSGVLGFIAVMSIILSFPAAAASDTHFGPWRTVDRWDGVGSTSYTPKTVAETTGGFAVGMGEITVDLTELEIPDGETVDLAIQTGTGSVELILPPEESARLELRIGAGEATWDIDGADGRSSGLGVRRTVANSAVTADEDPTFDIQVNVGLGNIDITQEN